MLRYSGLEVLTLRPTIVLSAGLRDAAFAQMILWFVPLLRKFERFSNQRTERWFRIFNESAVLLFTAIVVLVVVKPF